MDGTEAIAGRCRWRLRSRTLDFPRRPFVLGIVNVNDDSFCGDGTLDAGDAIAQAVAAVRAGADGIDFGAESARTNREAIPPGEEIRRIRRVLERWDDVCGRAAPRDAEQVWPPVLSINTWRPEVVAELVGDPRVDLINDMGTLPDARNARLCAEAGASLLIMHGDGAPKVARKDRAWEDVMTEMELFFQEKTALAREAGLDDESILLDPGIDFAKQRDDNLTVFRELGRLHIFGRPLLVPVSRKSVIGRVLGRSDPRERDAGTMACIALSMRQGAQIFRVHHVDACWSSIRVLHELLQG